MLNLYPHTLFWVKLLNQISVRKNGLWRYLPVGRISVRGFEATRSKEEFKLRLIRLLGDFNDISSLLTDEERKAVIALADQALAHEFDLLGSGPVKMEEIDWHSDFKSGTRWNRGVYYKKQRSQTKPGADIKVPWELSRCHHLLWLGEAWLISHDEKYAKEVVSEIEGWIADNPLMFSVNWVCTMDVAIRAVNWLFSLLMVIDADVVTDVFIATVDESLFRHGWFIFNNLEKNVPYSNNHLFSDYAGLLYLGFLFSGTKRGKSWKELALREYYEEIRRQILPSGVQYERSVSYHRLMTELVSYPYYLLKRQGIIVPPDIEYRIRSMLGFVSAYLKPNGYAPLVEDNDDGRFIPFLRRDFREHGYLLDESSIENRFVTAGLPGIGYEEERGSKIYTDARHAILRSGDGYVFVTNGGVSKYEDEKKTVGTHTHNDKLSFELTLGEDDVFVDPGAYVYTPDPKRSNEFRSTKKHNTVVVDEEEQNGLSASNVFLVKKNSRVSSFRMPSPEEVEGSYETLTGKMNHHRSFKCTGHSILIEDAISKTGQSHKVMLSFHCAEHVFVSVESDQTAIVETPHYRVMISFQSGDVPFRLYKEKDTVSPSYGVLAETETLRVEASFDEKLTMNTDIKWEKKQ